MMSSRTLGIVAIGLLLGLMTTEAVIAAPLIADQPSTEAAADNGTTAGVWFSLLLFPALGVVSLLLMLVHHWHTLPSQPRYETALTLPLGLGLMIGMLLAPLAMFPFLGVSVSDAAQTLTAREQIVLMSGAYTAQMLVVLLWMILDQRGRAEGSLRFGRALLLGAAGLALFWPMMQALSEAGGLVSEWLTHEVPDPLAHETLRTLAGGAMDVWKLALIGLVVFVTPIVEEVTYRGILQGTLRAIGLGPWTAISIVSLLFALMHVGAVLPHALPALFVLSLGFGWVVEKSGRVTASIVMHMLFNAGNVLAALMLT